MKKWNKRWLVNFFIVFNILAVLASTSNSSSQQNPIQKFFAPYLLWTRLLQNWPLFVPSPRKFAMKYRADITFKNGEVLKWQRPYPPNWNFFERHLSYSFQKWDLASNYFDKHKFLLEDWAHYLEHRFNTPANPIANINFVKSTAPWPLPRESGYVMPNENELQWSEKLLYMYDAPEKGDAP